MDKGTKNWYESTSIQGGIVAALGFIVNLLSTHYHYQLISTADLTFGVAGMMQVVGIVMGIYGRVTATQKIG